MKNFILGMFACGLYYRHRDTLARAFLKAYGKIEEDTRPTGV